MHNTFLNMQRPTNICSQVALVLWTSTPPLQAKMCWALLVKAPLPPSSRDATGLHNFLQPLLLVPPGSFDIAYRRGMRTKTCSKLKVGNTEMKRS